MLGSYKNRLWHPPEERKRMDMTIHCLAVIRSIDEKEPRPQRPPQGKLEQNRHRCEENPTRRNAPFVRPLPGRRCVHPLPGRRLQSNLPRGAERGHQLPPWPRRNPLGRDPLSRMQAYAARCLQACLHAEKGAAGGMSQRHKHLAVAPTMFADIILDRRIAALKAVFICYPAVDTQYRREGRSRSKIRLAACRCLRFRLRSSCNH